MIPTSGISGNWSYLTLSSTSIWISIFYYFGLPLGFDYFGYDYDYSLLTYLLSWGLDTYYFISPGFEIFFIKLESAFPLDLDFLILVLPLSLVSYLDSLLLAIASLNNLS